MQSIVYIYHVIGTLTWDHIVNSIKSLNAQGIYWDEFILYNAGDFPNNKIMELVDKSQFKRVSTFYPNNKEARSAIGDWADQMKNITGWDRYFVHKADFYLTVGVCKAFESLPDDFGFVLFNKLDMKEVAALTDLEWFANRGWDRVLKAYDVGTYRNHRGKLAVPWHQSYPPGVDATMHGYTEAARVLFKATEEESKIRWGVAMPIRRLAEQIPFYNDDRFFALHMWHGTPDRADLNKTEIGERF